MLGSFFVTSASMRTFINDGTSRANNWVPENLKQLGKCILDCYHYIKFKNLKIKCVFENKKLFFFFSNLKGIL